ncbi:MAG TPA: N-acetylglucosamine-6-phosphate deacetylase [Firmicutes bacterium]|nr:N-acetylglucosamine-6-phosphate deacetylase [Bacillota bacterium]HHT43135.1 N-acetylglucosamine-6-phosphate deacetylase [Bacillota bacterium]
MKHLIITNGTIVTDNLIHKGTVVTIGDRIMFVGGEEEGERILAAASPHVFQVIDAQGGLIAPGLIDVHMHGADGAELMDGTREAVETMARFVAKNGTVAFLPSTVTALEEKTRLVSQVVADYQDLEDGAEVLGIHLEGPYINEKYKGAQYGPAIRPASTSELEELHAVLGEKLRLVTLAPEVPGSLEAAQWLKDRGVTVSIGHTDATYDQAVQGFKSGITHVTHTFNGMRGLHHREPGVVGAVLATPGLYAELIADLIHVHPGAIQVLLRTVGVEHLVLVTDSVQATGLPDGEYVLGDNEIFVQDGAARLADGTLAGSTLTLKQAVRNMIEEIGVHPVDAFRMASLNPARTLGLEHRGWIREGNRADFVLLTADFEVQKTIIAGRVVYSAE